MVTWSESCSYIDLTRVSWRVKVISFTHYLVRFPYPLVTGYPQACQMEKPDYKILCKQREKKSWPLPWWHWFPLSCEKWTRGTDGPNLSGVRSTKFICSHHIMSSGESNGNHSRFYIIMDILFLYTDEILALLQYSENKIYSAIMFFAFQIETAAIEASVILNSRLSGS